MSDLDCLGVDEIGGFDYMSLLSGAGGMLSGFGGGGGGDAAKAKAEAEKRAAEQQAANTRLMMFGVLGLMGVGLIAVLVGRK